MSKATLGDYLIQDGGISQSLKELADQLKQATTYVWIRYADDEEGNGISALPAGKTYIAIKQVLGVPTASDDPADYRGLWVKFVGEGVPGPPGENGQPTYTWLKYADDYQGTNMTDDPTGKYYIGLATNKLTATESNDPKDYKWQLVKGEDGQDAHIYQAYSWSPDGTDRFATTYPNENLFSGDVAVQTYSSVSSNNASTYPITKEIRTESNFYFSRIRRSNPTQNPKVFSIFNGINLPEDFAAKLAGKKVTLSLLARGTSNVKMNLMARCVSATRTSALPGDYQVVNIGTGWTVVSLIVNSFPTDVQTLRFIPYSIIDPIPDLSQFFLDLSRWKIEFGDGTIYTPSPEDDFINAYPSYVGSYTTFDDVQSTNPADYTWQRILGMNGENGKDGIAGKDGVGVSDTNITYAQSTSGTSAPTSGWTIQVPALIKGQYLWTKTTWTYTDSSTETGYTVSYNAKDGNNGTDGIAGKDGVGISSTKIEYVSSTSGTVKPTTGWTTSIPTVPAGSFLWTKTTWTYTDGTNESGYSAAKMGEKGDQGIQGPKGSDGQTYYTWLKYADTPTSGMSDSPTGKAYIGLAYNKPTATESTNYADYTWSLIKGSDGAQGPKGDNGQTLYTWIKYATSATGAGMSDSPTGKTYIGLAYNKTTATESTNAADYTWSLIKGDKGDTGATGPQGPQGPTGPKGDRGLMGIAYVQQTQPSDKTEGVQWFKTDSTDKKIIASYVYKSGAWQEKKYASATLAVESLDALSANLGNITAGNISGVLISGSEFQNPFTNEPIDGGDGATGSTASGKSTLKGKLSFDGEIDTSHKFSTEYGPARLGGAVRLKTASPTADPALMWWLNPYGLTLRVEGVGGTLRYQDLIKFPQRIIDNVSTGFEPYATSVGSTSTPTCERSMRSVQLSGAFKNTVSFSGEKKMATLPVGYRPSAIVSNRCQGSGNNTHYISVYPDGSIYSDRYTAGTVPLGSWLKIDISFLAGDV